MGDRKKGLSCSSSSSSSRLLWLMMPLFLVTMLVGLLNIKDLNWVSGADSHPWSWSSFLASFSSSHSGHVSTREEAAEGPVSAPKEEESGLHRVVSLNNREQAAASQDYIVKRSASPPLAVQIQPMNYHQRPVSQKEERLNVTIIGPQVFPSLNESHALPMSERLRRKFGKLVRLEGGLWQARAAIREAKNGNKSYDPDYVPAGPIYLNPSAFHRSYLEMEKQFKVFIYNEGEPPIFHNGPCKNIYAMEGNFIYLMETSQFRTRDPDKAHVYFLPVSVTAIVHFVFDRGSRDWQPMRQIFRDYVNIVSGKYPYWNRSQGADHFMLACHDWGPALSFSVPALSRNSIRALCNANTSEGFKPSKDVSFPEILLPSGTLDGLLGGPSPSQRPYLVFFAGGVHGPIRPVILDYWENKDEDVKVHKYLPKGVSYYGMMRKSKYCLCPSGYEVASPRMVEALYTGCVPVLIKDHYVTPFSDVLNWKSFSVEIPVKEIPNLKKILNKISVRQYIRLQRRGKLARRHFEINMPPKRYDVFHMILHSIWLRRLNVLVHDFDVP